MKKIIYIAFVLGMFLGITSCEERDIEVFGTEHFIYFEKFWKDAVSPGTEKADSTMTTFFFAKETDQSVYADVVLVMSGRQLEKDLHFQLRVVDDMTTALPNEYTLQDEYVFRARPVADDAIAITDTIQIQLNRSERLETMKDGYRLVVELVPNSEVKVGQTERSRAIIRIMQDPVKPDWWDKEVDTYLLGSYSATKYKTFLENIEGAYDLNAEMIKDNPTMARKLALDFKKWLIDYNGNHPDEPLRDENGELIEVPV